jgi:hypothetical protein
MNALPERFQNMKSFGILLLSLVFATVLIAFNLRNTLSACGTVAHGVRHALRQAMTNSSSVAWESRAADLAIHAQTARTDRKVSGWLYLLFCLDWMFVIVPGGEVRKAVSGLTGKEKGHSRAALGVRVLMLPIWIVVLGFVYVVMLISTAPLCFTRASYWLQQPAEHIGLDRIMQRPKASVSRKSLGSHTPGGTERGMIVEKLQHKIPSTLGGSGTGIRTDSFPPHDSE